MRAGERIIALRTQRGLKQSGLARLSGVSQGSLSEIEAGTRAPTETTIQKICDALNISISQFFAEVDADDKDFDVLAGGSVVPPGAGRNPLIGKIAKELYNLTPEQFKVVEAVIKAMKNH